MSEKLKKLHLSEIQQENAISLIRQMLKNLVGGEVTFDNAKTVLGVRTLFAVVMRYADINESLKPDAAYKDLEQEAAQLEMAQKVFEERKALLMGAGFTSITEDEDSKGTYILKKSNDSPIEISIFTAEDSKVYCNTYNPLDALEALKKYMDPKEEAFYAFVDNDDFLSWLEEKDQKFKKYHDYGVISFSQSKWDELITEMEKLEKYYAEYQKVLKKEQQ